MVKLPADIKKYGFQTMDTPSEIDKTVGNNLSVLIEQSEKLLSCYQEFSSSEDGRLRDFLLEAMSSYINHIAQAFRDIVAYILINDSSNNGKIYDESLGFYVRQYLSMDIAHTPDSQKAVEYLKQRNDLVHDYFNINKRNHELAVAVSSYGKGFIELAIELKDYCYEHYPEIAMNQNIKKVIRKGAKQSIPKI